MNKKVWRVCMERNRENERINRRLAHPSNDTSVERLSVITRQQ